MPRELWQGQVGKQGPQEHMRKGGTLAVHRREALLGPRCHGERGIHWPCREALGVGPRPQGWVLMEEVGVYTGDLSQISQQPPRQY